MKGIKEEESDEDEEEDKVGKVEAAELEKIIEDKHANYSKISRHYKLFEYISKADTF